MHGPINVKSPNNTSKWHMGFNSAFKELICVRLVCDDNGNDDDDDGDGDDDIVIVMIIIIIIVVVVV
jgi:hypothetical protein